MGRKPTWKMMEKWDLMRFYGILMGFNGIYDGYPLVMTNITMERSTVVQQENPL